MELSKQEMELFLLFLDLELLWKISIILFTTESNPILNKFFKQELKLLILFIEPFYCWEPKEAHLDNVWLLSL